MRYALPMASERLEYARGTKVGVRVGGFLRAAVVVEDRGIFVGHRIVRIRELDDFGDFDDVAPREYEISTDELEPGPAAPNSAAA